MVITKIEGQRRKDRVNIYIDGEFAFGLTEELRFKYDLYVGRKITQEFIDSVLKSEERLKVIDAALNFLSYRQRSEKEVYQRLRQRGYEEEYILDAIDYCKDKGYINDLEFARSFVKDKINLNNFGPVRIKNELYKKGVSSEIIQQVLNMDEEEEYEMAFKLAEKRLARYRNDERDQIYRKLGGFLQRRGFSYGVVTRILKELLSSR